MRPPVQDFCSSDLGMVPVRDMNTETARQMPEDLPALSDAVKAFVWSWVTLTFFSLKTSPKDGKKPKKLGAGLASVHMCSGGVLGSAGLQLW